MTYFANASFGNKTAPAYVIDNNTGIAQQYYGGHQAMQAAQGMENQYANQGRRGVNAALGGGFGGGDPFMQQSMQQSQQIQQMRNQGMYGGTGNQQRNNNSLFTSVGGSGGGGYSGGGGAAFGSGNIQGLLDKQLAENAWAKGENQANWNTARGMIQGLDSQYFGDPITQGARQNTQALLNDPLSMNADVVSKLQSKAAGQIDNSVNQQMRDAQYMQAMNGQTDASSMQAAAERADRMALGQRVGAQSQIDIQKAMQDKNDQARAIGVGQQQSQMDQGVRQNQAALFADTMPQYKADDLSGLIASLGMYNFGVNGGQQQMGGGNPQGQGTDGTAGGAFSGWKMFQPNMLSVNNQSGTPQNGAGWNSMFNTKAADAWDAGRYQYLKNEQNANNKNSFNNFAAAKPTAYGNQAPSPQDFANFAQVNGMFGNPAQRPALTAW